LHILIASANGYGNVGDDLATLAVSKFFKRQLKNPTIHFTRPPMDTALVRWADVVVVGGGGLFFDTLPDNVENYLSYLRVAQAQHKLTMVIGIGTQGIKTESAKKAYREVLNKTDLITVRHQHDADALHAVGVTQEVHVLADPVFALPKARQPYPAQPPSKRRPIVAVSLANTRQRPEVMQKLEPELREKWQKLQDKTDAGIAELTKMYDVRLVLHSEDDRETYEGWSKAYNIPILGGHAKHNTPHASKDTAALYADADYVLTSRFHGLILALLAKKPVFALGFEGTKIHWTIQTQVPALQAFYMSSEAFIENNTASLAGCVQELKSFHAISHHVARQVAQTSRKARWNEHLIAKKLRKTKSRFKLIQSRIRRVQPAEWVTFT
jgi:polysaccharide pyruvyl transferase WcaK-like protein